MHKPLKSNRTGHSSTLLELLAHHREDAGLFSATTIIMLQCGYLLYIKYLICFISFNIIITFQGRSHLHLIDEKSKPQKDGGLLVIDPGLEPEAFRSLFAGPYTCLKTVKQSYLNKMWTDISNSLLFSRISAWSLQFEVDLPRNHSPTLQQHRETWDNAITFRRPVCLWPKASIDHVNRGKVSSTLVLTWVIFILMLFKYAWM